MAAGLQTFQIVLDTAEHKFLPGETISGRVIIELGRAKSVRGVKLRFKGKGEVKWSESRGSGKSRHTTWYIAEENYFRMDLFLLGEADGSENVEIVSGHHIFPFNFSLPPNIPNSFEHDYGNIRYSIKAIIDRPWKFDHETSLHFTVAAPFDLAQDPTSGMIINDEEQKSFCCFPCIDMGSMNVNVHIPTSGYAVGDPIEVRIVINNNSSSVDVTAVKLKLKQLIMLHASTKSKTVTLTVQKAEKSGPFGKIADFTVGLQVPAVPSSNFLNTNLIDILYRLAVKICVSDCHCSLKREFPILIGERLDPNWEAAANAHGIPAQNPLQFPTFQPNAPNAPFFGAEDPTPFPIAGGQPFPIMDNYKNGHTPYPSNSAQTYGFATAVQPYSPSVPGPAGVPAFPYPPACDSAIGFVPPSPARYTSTTVKPPPSYEECVTTNK